ncbi:acyclic terpene utilization AtuA family protein [Variovorax paradoxus]|uniref:Acyclic terpene utilization AtuA family protein n=1 Tax=Variovorax paradoxus TaxID=34073 RepID=A0A6I6HIA6_VARPD|nr:acyclic terpene utilization AtuA family protein [Variovorax paradoxus]QGW80107.1 acyclic terpene utilization AtuA family protein [Variovorax paradoxus]
MNRTVRIGGASGFWGDSSVGAPQLVASRQIDYLVFDYLAELTMSILAGARLKKPELGYATDFVSVAMKAVLQDVVQQGIRVVSNAGGVNPQGCADALAALAAEHGIALKIAVVSGDDVSPLLPQLRQQQPAVRELQSGAPLPERVLTANAYLGATPIQAALDAGAQVVITGRCVDSAVILGVLMHEFGWQPGDHDLLAAGSLAGHIIECGCQATGGLHTDWDTVPDWPNIGYPIVECHADGRFVVTKPSGTGGKVTPAVVGEQMLYEIGDPSAYLLPDVVADFTQVRIEQAGNHRVRVHGARGRAPTASYKVCATYVDGFKAASQLTIVGFDAVAKAQRTGEAILTRTSTLFAQHDYGPYSGTQLEVLGAESCYGPHARATQTREAVLRIAVTHPRKEALELFAREVAPAGTSWAPGTTGAASGRSAVSPSIRQYAFLLDKSKVEARVEIDGQRIEVPCDAGPVAGEETFSPKSPTSIDEPQAASFDADADIVAVPLIRLAWARSGDKGDTSNIGVITRHPALLPLLREQLTETRVAEWLAHLVKGPVTRYEVPGIGAFNFVCEQALGGGGMASLRNDALGKGMGQILLAMPVRVGAEWLALLEAGAPADHAAAGA